MEINRAWARNGSYDASSLIQPKVVRALAEPIRSFTAAACPAMMMRVSQILASTFEADLPKQPILFSLQATDVSLSFGLCWAAFSGGEAVRFLVDLYRLLLFAGLALGLVAASYAVSLSFGQSGSLAFGGYVLGAVIAGAIVIIFALGLTATFISIHDRLAEIAEHSERIAQALERSSAPPASGGDL